MDPAEETAIRSALSQQVALLGQHQEQISISNRTMEVMASQLTELTTLVQRLHLPPDPSPAQDLPPPSDPMCESIPQLHTWPTTFTSDTMKIAYVITLLSGKAGEWGTAMWDNRHACCSSYEAFPMELLRVFNHTAQGREAGRLLSGLSQGNRSVVDIAIEFRTLAASSDWRIIRLCPG
ncbi:protein LDOC1-like [Myxocyprinus asiaticus]|uniref:protein LDOC1-like n=1 Tax=Myxocyprinus asiaticus TaxID=70543 RepID=UPI0022232703|nr:protein LDOC1-like [Myxocyprinus asiaticus]